MFLFSLSVSFVRKIQLLADIQSINPMEFFVCSSAQQAIIGSIDHSCL